MIKIKIKNLTIEDFEILRLNYKADIDEVLTFESYEDFTYFCEVIGYYRALKIIRVYGLCNAQNLANECGINEPLANIEALATRIMKKVLEKYLED